MGTEYYIVCHDCKEITNIGKHAIDLKNETPDSTIDNICYLGFDELLRTIRQIDTYRKHKGHQTSFMNEHNRFFDEIRDNNIEYERIDSKDCAYQKRIIKIIQLYSICWKIKWPIRFIKHTIWKIGLKKGKIKKYFIRWILKDYLNDIPIKRFGWIGNLRNQNELHNRKDVVSYSNGHDTDKVIWPLT